MRTAGYGNHATDALCWISSGCQLFCSSFCCVSSPFTNGFVLNIRERSWGADFGYSRCCRHTVGAHRVRLAGAARSHGWPLNRRTEIGRCFQAPLRHGQGGEPQPSTPEQRHGNKGSISSLLLNWVYYLLLWLSAGGQCYLKAWLLSKARAHMLQVRSTDRSKKQIQNSQTKSKFSISLLNSSATADHKRHHFSFCMKSCLGSKMLPWGSALPEEQPNRL